MNQQKYLCFVPSRGRGHLLRAAAAGGEGVALLLLLARELLLKDVLFMEGGGGIKINSAKECYPYSLGVL